MRRKTSPNLLCCSHNCRRNLPHDLTLTTFSRARPRPDAPDNRSGRERGTHATVYLNVQRLCGEDLRTCDSVPKWYVACYPSCMFLCLCRVMVCLLCDLVSVFCDLMSVVRPVIFLMRSYSCVVLSCKYLALLYRYHIRPYICVISPYIYLARP